MNNHLTEPDHILDTMKRETIDVADFTCNPEHRACFYRILDKYGVQYIKASWRE